ncbi:hypothetical protein FB567DRAFT_302111 [Paraphoma chrysanthemicola]|uniref:Ankyrin n=1 Tax=Paraphoma chrysanthemicola TaxID=798071 RepID=A0A8K0RB26_9PLEO|nr:hypothetical protein FB567DRAFT_302111 [Paraphoma chrysanthemicola]
MILQCLPAELCHEVLLYVVSNSDLKQTLRLRLVNRAFSVDILKALHATSVLDDYIQQNRIVAGRSLEYDQFWQEYLTRKIFRNRVSLSVREQTVHDAAVRVFKQTGDDKPALLRACISALCYKPHRILTTEDLPTLLPWDRTRHLLQAAIILDRMEVVKSLLDCPDFHGVFGGVTGSKHCPKPAEIWDNPIDLASQFARADILELLFTDRRLNRTSLRAQAFRPAMRAGHLHIVEYILDPAWGSYEFILGVSCVYKDLIMGILRSPLIDFYPNICVLCGSPWTPDYSVQTIEPDVNQVLYEIAYQTPQREDVAMWLLDHGAVVQQRGPPRNRAAGSPSPSEPRYPWNPLRQAVRGGNEKIVRLLLDRGADPLSTDNDLIELAVKSGRLDIVRMLIEHTPETPTRWTDGMSSTVQASKSLLPFAISSGNEKLYEYLRCNPIQESQAAVILEESYILANKTANLEANKMPWPNRPIFEFHAKETTGSEANTRNYGRQPRRRT